MAIFDIRTYLALTGRGQNGILALGSAFGMPQCMLNLGADVLQLLPTSVLLELASSTESGRDAADEVIKKIVKYTLGWTGIIEYDTEEGVFRFVSDTSKFGMDSDEGSTLNQILGLINATAAFGGRLYQNYQATQAQINNITNCFRTYKTYLDYVGGTSAEKKQELATTDPDAFRRLFEAEYDQNRRRLLEATNFVNRANSLLTTVNGILADRADNPDREPAFNPDASDLLRNTGFRIGVGRDSSEEDKELIRLVFGPPRSKTGQFLLSVDGLYYDSQSPSGVIKVLGQINKFKSLIQNENKWKFEYDPNIGGKGVAVSNKVYTDYLTTLFDPAIIDDSIFLQKFYDADHFLQQILGQKNKRLQDLTRQADEIEADEDSSLAIISNFRQSIISESSYHEDKIRRRKKQIEIAVKAPSIYSNAAIFAPGEIPINDFSYLQDFNFSVDLIKQKRLILDQDEVSGVVLPVQSKFVQSVSNDTTQSLNFLYVPEIGAAGVIHDGYHASSQDGLYLDLSDKIVTNGLIAAYNYLETFIVPPSSTSFKTTNCASEEGKNYAQLVAKSPEYAFTSGIGTVYLGGITDHVPTNPSVVSGYNSYIRLPDTNDFHDWMYSQNGSTFETWIHLPKLNDWKAWGYNTASSLYRLILSCENFGIADTIKPLTSVNNIKPVQGETYVRGMVMGFTRDQRFLRGMYASEDHFSQDPVSGVNFVLAPTQSISASAIAFTNRTDIDAYGCESTPVFHGFTMPTSSAGAGGSKFEDLTWGWGLLDVVVNPELNSVSVYINSNLMGTSSIPQVFGTPDNKPPKLPNFFKRNSFSYSGTNFGPKLDKYFTPWILGGGYTDGASAVGNFMGQGHAGISSGLRGYLGGTKFYNRALSQSEITLNYESTKAVFENIEVTTNFWDPIYSGEWGP